VKGSDERVHARMLLRSAQNASFDIKHTRPRLSVLTVGNDGMLRCEDSNIEDPKAEEILSLRHQDDSLISTRDMRTRQDLERELRALTA
jgi:hypothetical protein